jgi:hypothetical protein
MGERCLGSSEIPTDLVPCCFDVPTRNSKVRPVYLKGWIVTACHFPVHLLTNATLQPSKIGFELLYIPFRGGL